MEQKNGAVSEDCAAPHENPNLTHSNLTVNMGFRSKAAGKRIQDAAKPFIGFILQLASLGLPGQIGTLYGGTYNGGGVGSVKGQSTD
jgi:hypothetical protein